MYIVFEGIVGSGKSTQVNQLTKWLRQKGQQVTVTREPGGCEIAEAIRVLVQGTKFTEDMDAVCEAYLYAAARAQSLRKIVQPALEQQNIVISDRSFITSLAYQAVARGLPIQQVLEINKHAIAQFIPDMILFLDIDPHTGYQRTFDKNGDKFERLPVSFFEKVQQGYHQIASMNVAKQWYTIDASGSKQEVFEKIISVMENVSL